MSRKPINLYILMHPDACPLKVTLQIIGGNCIRPLKFIWQLVELVRSQTVKIAALLYVGGEAVFNSFQLNETDDQEGE